MSGDRGLFLRQTFEAAVAVPARAGARAYRGLDRIRRAASRAGRDPEELTYGYNVGVLVREGAASTRGRVAGDPEKVAKQLARLVRGGFSLLNMLPAGDGTEQRERLARQVLPILRAEIGSRSTAHGRRDVPR